MSQFHRSFRLTCQKDQIPFVEDLLKQEGFVFEKEPFYELARKLVLEPFPLGASLAAFFGYIYIQDRSSMLPPLALAPYMKEITLDMCASPGSKTGLLAQLADKNCFILANEPNSERRATLVNNLINCNFLNVGTSSYPGEKLPLPPGSFPAILLDPPCSGWGTTNKHPGIKSFWSGKKIDKLISLQKKLLKKACDLLEPDGHLIYSTCTTNKAENEGQIKYATDELGLNLIPLAHFEGFKFDECSQTPGALLVNEQESKGQGFFIAHLHKPGQNDANLTQDKSIVRKLKDLNAVNNFKIYGISGIPYGLSANLSCFLPRGSLKIFGENLYFLSAPSAKLPQDFKWKGLLIGKINSGGIFSVNSNLKNLSAFLYRNYKAIHFENIEPLKNILAGQSISLSHPFISINTLKIDPECIRNTDDNYNPKIYTLWWKNLPLGLAQVKSGRIVPKFH